MQKFDQKYWDTIFNNLETKQVALFIGPGIVHLNGKILNQALHESLNSRFQDQIVYYYEQDGLFRFEDDIAKTDAAQYVRKFLNENQPDEEIFTQIARLKFPLILSINPDTYLSDICYKYNIRHRFSYFKSNQKATEDVEEPTIEQPLIYNLCGSKNEDESIILDYEDLFRLIASAVGSPGLPNKLKVALDRMRLFIFVGFQFENWQTQLLLRLLCGEKKTRKYASSYSSPSENLKGFLYHQFQIEFWDEGHSFVQELYNQSAARNMLKDISAPESTDAIDIIRLIQTDKDLFKSFELMLKRTEQTPLHHEVTILMGSYNTFMDERRRGVLDSRDVITIQNKIVDGMLHILKEKKAPA